MNHQEERLADDAVRALIAKLQQCLAESDAAATDD
jgi:hypothetical protein